VFARQTSPGRSLVVPGAAADGITFRSRRFPRQTSTLSGSVTAPERHEPLGRLRIRRAAHESFQWILAHYYPGTTLSYSDSLVSTDPMVSVDLNENAEIL